MLVSRRLADFFPTLREDFDYICLYTLADTDKGLDLRNRKLYINKLSL